ncbi:lipocalin-like protein [Flavobacterium cutihirudinis]|uniref:Lipocalin-like protein n=1 Tax=Flavobacterium cutihirudinis TaxID=1265740 RepID=A0A3D9FXL7_9FLAO|nr:lipocalin family protein [Flavobacterium cutihirudinis]RED25494.1 lipocalin-like protein [Flavobacterium cutihirudinis]
MKKISILFLSVLALSLAVVSCNDNDDEIQSIEGKWVPVKLGKIVDGKEVLSDYPNEHNCESDVMEFTNDSKFTDLMHLFADNNCMAVTAKGTWLLNEKHLTLTYEDQQINNIEILELTKSVLKIKYTGKSDEAHMFVITIFERKQ